MYWGRVSGWLHTHYFQPAKQTGHFEALQISDYTGWDIDYIVGNAGQHQSSRAGGDNVGSVDRFCQLGWGYSTQWSVKPHRVDYPVRYREWLPHFECIPSSEYANHIYSLPRPIQDFFIRAASKVGSRTGPNQRHLAWAWSCKRWHFQNPKSKNCGKTNSKTQFVALV